MATTEVRGWHAVLGATTRKLQLLLENSNGIWACDTVQCIKKHFEVLVFLQKALDEIEIENLLDHDEVVRDWIDDLDLEGSISLCADRCQIDVWKIRNLITGQVFSYIKDLVRHGLRCGGAIGQIVFDTEIILRSYRVNVSSHGTDDDDTVEFTARVMASRKEDPAGCLSLADDMTGCWRAENAILTDQELLDPIGGPDSCNQLHDLGIPISAISSDYQETTGYTFGYCEQDARHEGFAIMWLSKDCDFLPEAGSTCRISINHTGGSTLQTFRVSGL